MNMNANTGKVCVLLAIVVEYNSNSEVVVYNKKLIFLLVFAVVMAIEVNPNRR